MPNNKKQPFPEDKRINYPELVADECCDQLPIFSRVGRGLRGDSISAEYRYDPDTGYAFLDITTTDANGNQTTESFRVDAGCLHYAYKMFPNLGCFAITFAYDHPVDTMRWTWTTPLIPFIYNNESEFDYTGTMVKDVFTYPYGDSSDAVDQLIYPELTTREDWNAPGFGDEWTVDLSYGDPAADIPCPTFDQLNDYALKTYVDDAIDTAILDPWPIANGGTGVTSYSDSGADFSVDNDVAIYYDSASNTFKGISAEKLTEKLQPYIRDVEFDNVEIDIADYYSILQSDPNYYNPDPDETNVFPGDVSGTIMFSRYGRYCNIAIKLVLKLSGTFLWKNKKRYCLLPRNNDQDSPHYDVYPDGYIAFGPADHIEAPMHCRKQTGSAWSNYSVQDGIAIDANWWGEYPGNSIWIGNELGENITFDAASGDYPYYIIEGAISYMQGDHIPSLNLTKFDIEDIPSDLKAEYKKAIKEQK